MKKVIIFLSLCALLLCSCGNDGAVMASGDEQTNAPTAGESTSVKAENDAGLYVSADGTFEEADFYFSPDGKTALTADDDIAAFTQAFGEPDAFEEAPSCNYDGNDKVYTYPGFTVYTYPDGEVDRVSIIELHDADVGTPKDIHVGMSVDRVTEKYGDGYDTTGYLYVYNAKNGTLSFTVENETVTLIEYVSYN